MRTAKVLAEQDDEWRPCRRYFSEESMASLGAMLPTESKPAPKALAQGKKKAS